MMIDSREPRDLDDLIERSLRSEGLAPVPPGLADRICMSRLRGSETRRVRMSLAIGAAVMFCSSVFVGVSAISLVSNGWVDHLAPGFKGILDSWVCLAPERFGDILLLACVAILAGLAVASLSLIHISGPADGAGHSGPLLGP